ncbi:MAG: pyridoxal phosphate-dependent aminotransferase [bacterium]
MTKKVAAAGDRFIGEGAFAVLAKARALEGKGKSIIHLEIGEPDFDTPRNIKDAAADYLLNKGFTHYTASAGLMDTRVAVAEYISRTRGVPVEPSQVVVTPGAKPAIFAGIVGLVEAGDEVIIPLPAYPSYESLTRYAGGTPVFVPLLEERNFVMDTDHLVSLISPRSKLIVLNSPQNPTGGVLGHDDLKAISEAAVKYDVYVLADEIYSRILYEGKHESILQFPGMAERTILIDGFSKTYAMTGWRLGYGVYPKHLVDRAVLIVNNMVSCATAFVQMAGIDALRGPQGEVDKMVAEFKRRRDIIVDGLNSIPGVTCKRPRGAFYVFPNVKSFKRSSDELADLMMNEAGVALLSGAAFGRQGEGYLRLSYANSVENIQKAVARMKGALAKLH